MSGGISVTYTARLDGIRLGVWGGRRRGKRRTLSRDALLHEGMRLIKGLGVEDTNKLRDFGLCLSENGSVTRRTGGEDECPS